MRREATVNRMKERIEKLIAQFDAYVEAFGEEELFTGPSVYFHRKTRALLAEHDAPCDALEDDRFFETLYATLTAWGMHRMGRGQTKLVPFGVFRRSFIAQKLAIRKLETLEIDQIPSDRIGHVSAKLWDIIENLRVGIGSTKIVAGSKALHHLLPELVPPIDGKYTLRFFYGQRETGLNQGDRTAFLEIYPHFCRVASARSKNIQKHVAEGIALDGSMNTSKTKVIDNAIVGFVLRKLRK